MTRVVLKIGGASTTAAAAPLRGLVTSCYEVAVVHGVRQDVEPDVSGTSCTIELDLGLGDGRASYLTSDLSYDYVRINADYRT